MVWAEHGVVLDEQRIREWVFLIETESLLVLRNGQTLKMELFILRF